MKDTKRSNQKLKRPARRSLLICLTAFLETVGSKINSSRIEIIGDRLNMTKAIYNFRLSICMLTLTLLAIATAHAQNAIPGNITPPDVPDKIKVEPGNKLFLVGRAVGTQNYVCKPSGSGFKFVLYTPEATLFGGVSGRQVITHFFSPNPFETNTDSTVVTPAFGDPGLIRATWQHSQDSSRVWAFATPATTLTSADSPLVEQGAVAWLLLKASGTQDGPSGGDALSGTTFVQRLNTHGGVAPSTGCTSAEEVGNEAFVPYTADYFFYEKDPSQADLSH